MSEKEVMETLVGNALLHIVPDTFDGGCLLEMDENYGGNLLVRMMPGDEIVLQITTKLSEYGPQATEYVKTVYSVEEKSVTYSKTKWDNCGFPGQNIIKVFVKSNILLSVSTEEDKTPAPRSEMTMIMVNEKSRDTYGQDGKIDCCTIAAHGLDERGAAAHERVEKPPGRKHLEEVARGHRRLAERARRRRRRFRSSEGCAAS